MKGRYAYFYTLDFLQRKRRGKEIIEVLSNSNKTMNYYYLKRGASDENQKIKHESIINHHGSVNDDGDIIFIGNG
jgi:hypothetical protein